jgi:hypothetical protein
MSVGPGETSKSSWGLFVVVWGVEFLYIMIILRSYSYDNYFFMILIIVLTQQI